MREIKRMIQYLQDERNGAALYEALASMEKEARLAEVYRRMAMGERRHAANWERRLNEAGVALPPLRLTWRTRTLIWLAKRFGPRAVLPSVVALERIDADKYSLERDERLLAADESSHARVLQQISLASRSGLDGSIIARLEGRHHALGGNALRAAVLGANDGLVSNLSLVMGVAGAELSNQTILITGLAGMLAGAISMALGEWLSVQSSRELYQHQISIERQEIAEATEEEAEELALIYQARGIDEAQARRLASQIMSNEESAVETMAREELGMDPEELGGSAWEAAIASFLLFALGAVVPVFPFMFLRGVTAIVTSAILSAIGLFIIGSGITLFTGRSVLLSGLRQVLFGLAAAAVTYLIGLIIGVNISG